MGGASTYDHPVQPRAIDWPEQVEAVIAFEGGTLNSDALYVIYAGAFDIINSGYYPPPDEFEELFFVSLVGRVGENVYAAIQALHAAGALIPLALSG